MPSLPLSLSTFFCDAGSLSEPGTRMAGASDPLFLALLGLETTHSFVCGWWPPNSGPLTESFLQSPQSNVYRDT